MGMREYGGFYPDGDIGVVFKAAQRRARQHGHGGYTGTIAEASRVEVVHRSPPMEWSKAVKWARERWGDAPADRVARAVKVLKDGKVGWWIFGWGMS